MNQYNDETPFYDLGNDAELQHIHLQPRCGACGYQLESPDRIASLIGSLSGYTPVIKLLFDCEQLLDPVALVISTML